jgi:hypothetical protein
MSIEIHPSGDYLAAILHPWGLHDVARDVWLLPVGAKVDAGEVETRELISSSSVYRSTRRRTLRSILVCSHASNADWMLERLAQD